ncbi:MULTISPECIES: potassium-transporting ATPase subunit C [Acidiplasma]|uniref:ATPase n=1 Tax=Acidiplasma cupricumulans TaxID=312540 RepID=A0A0Q0XJJ6_9ARCH|nr:MULTISPECIES: potassium-transporting ATPase subunit C [Acidiplasma]KJE49127.1 ATPase [Acidiplasma sp. MBA-1]KQB35098.1 ATPase [Acidiplasma cupricumulans]WMT54939.1 MAG: potassium-transporting ATPase subunit C [Acidiplasma sp.]
MVKLRIIKAFALAILIMFVAGFAFPAVTSLITESTLPYYSNGHPVKYDGKIVDSYLLTEAFNESYFFQPRPSAVNDNISSSGSYSTSLSNKTTLELSEKYLKEFEERNHVNASQIPYAMITYSGSGVGYAIPLKGATLQVHRIAVSISNLSGGNLSISSIESFLNGIINKDKQRNFPVFGTYYVNVVQLNMQILNYLKQNNIYVDVH